MGNLSRTGKENFIQKNLERKIALSFLKGFNSQMLKAMNDEGFSIDDFFENDFRDVLKEVGVKGKVSFDSHSIDKALIDARLEIEKISRHHIKPIFLLDDDYPVRLFEITDAPIVLYKLGKADIDSSHILSVVGTRRPTAYGLDFCKKLISDISGYFPDATVVSGLAFGIDAAAHKESLENSLPTVAVVAHGLDMIYPAMHRTLAQKIIHEGGALLSEYPFGEQPYRQRFLERNRIVAALSDVTIVVESDIKGGAMSTANMAFSYSRDVMALPGRISDSTSAGCNLLIRQEKARLISSAADILEVTGWQPEELKINPTQRNLFPELGGNAKKIYDILRFNNSEPMQLDRLHQLSLIPMPRLMAVLGELEFDGIVIRHPGNRFSIA